jgi:hypothetical protein
MRNFTRLLVGLALLCLFSNAIAQQPAGRTLNMPLFTTYLDATDYAFSNLDKSYVTTGILYDRAFKNAHLDVFQPDENSSAGHWLQAYYELYEASTDRTSLLTSDDMDNLVYEAANNTATVPLGVISAEFNVLNYDAIETTVSGTPYVLKTGYTAAQTFLTKRVVVASPLVPSIPKGTTGFSMPRWATFSCGTVYVTSIVVNFGDGNLVRTFSPGGLSQPVIFNTEGEKILEFTIKLSNGTQKSARASILVTNDQRVDNSQARALAYPKPDIVGIVDSSDIWATIPFQGYEDNRAMPGYGQYLTYFAAGRTKLRKPLIIIDGFDPGEERFAQTVYDRKLLYLNNVGRNVNLGDELRENTPNSGYDVIVLNLPKYHLLYFNIRYVTRSVSDVI